MRFEHPIKELNTLLFAADGQEELILGCLNRFYKLVSRGELKAHEGYSYEDILVKYLHCCGIGAERKTPENKKTKNSRKKDQCRKWDVYIPSKSAPKVVIECMYNVTTSSGQTTKHDRVLNCSTDLQEKGISVFVLMDGAGWIVRASDAKKYLEEENICVFTFHRESLKKLVKFVIDKL